MIYLRLPFPALLKNVWKKFFWLQDELQCVSVELGKEQRHTENILELKTFRILNIKGSSKGLNPPQRLRSCKLRHSTLCLAHITLPWGCAVHQRAAACLWEWTSTANRIIRSYLVSGSRVQVFSHASHPPGEAPCKHLQSHFICLLSSLPSPRSLGTKVTGLDVSLASHPATICPCRLA